MAIPTIAKTDALLELPYYLKQDITWRFIFRGVSALCDITSSSDLHNTGF